MFDLDRTIYPTHSFFEVVEDQVNCGLIDKGVLDQIHSLMVKYKAGEQAYTQTATELLRAWAVSLVGMEYELVLGKTKEFFETRRDKFYRYFEEVLPLLKQTHDVYIVTTNAQMVADTVAKQFELKGYISSEFEIVGGKFSGKISSTLAGGKGVVTDLVSRYFGASIAVGDSGNDIEMLKLVRYPICYSPDEELAGVARMSGWMVTDENSAAGDITDLLKSIRSHE